MRFLMQAAGVRLQGDRKQTEVEGVERALFQTPRKQTQKQMHGVTGTKEAAKPPIVLPDLRVPGCAQGMEPSELCILRCMVALG